MQKVILIILLLIIPALVSAQSKSEAERLWELADKAYKESRFYDAIHYYEKALGYYPKDSLEAGGLYDEIGLCYMQLGDHAKAIKYFEISINITKKFNKIDYLSDVYDHIGQAYTALENFEKAKFYLEESLKIRKKLNDSFRLAETYNNLGLLYWRMEQHGKALSNYEEALKLLTNNNDYEQEMGYVLSNIGMVYLNLGLYEKAEKYLTESLRIREKYKNPQDLTIIYNNLGGLYSEIGNYDKSIYYYSRASEVSKKMGLLEDYGLNLMNLAAIYHSAGKYKEALKFYMESLKLFESINSIAYIVRNIENIAHIYLDLKDYKSAKFYFDKADKESFKISKRFDLGIIEFYIAIKDYSKALEILQKAPDDSIQSSLYKTQLYTQFGIVYLNTGNYINATESFLKAVNLAEEIRKKATERQNIFKSVIYKGLIRPYKGLVSALAEAYFKNYNYLPNFKNYGNTSASSAFYFSELTKARTLLEAMAGARKKIESPEIPQDLKEAENRILQELSYIDGRWEEAMKKGEQAVKELQARREGIKKQLDELIEVLRKSYPRYAALNYPLPVKAEDLPLRESEVLLEYAITDEATYLFIVRKGGVKRIVKIPLNKDILEETVKSFIEPMNLKKPEGFSIREAKRLYDILLSEALKDVRENEKIIIVPDGILGLLPFEALVIKE
ncbi:MAG: CHAT domain-containing protein, partial [bacterium]|nr:CHAT domain-containing protein [bacterium]